MDLRFLGYKNEDYIGAKYQEQPARVGNSASLNTRPALAAATTSREHSKIPKRRAEFAQV